MEPFVLECAKSEFRKGFMKAIELMKDLREGGPHPDYINRLQGYCGEAYFGASGNKIKAMDI